LPLLEKIKGVLALNYKAVIFDLDGTLVNSLNDLADSANAVLAQFGYPTFSVSEYKYFVGNGSRKLIERILPAEHRTDAEIDMVLSQYRTLYNSNLLHKTKPYAGMPEVIQALKKQGIPLAVCTNKHCEAAQKIVTTLYGENIFSGLVADKPGTDFKRKPDPSNALKLAASLHVLPQEVAYLGDSKVDMQTAVKAGFLPVGVLWGFRTEAELVANGAKILLHEPKELLEKVTFAK
jgi:phosphoglycolate phosphatase